jgi:exopolysaccharide biosynthesis polyprenyl glycosylphosphotransferase
LTLPLQRTPLSILGAQTPAPAEPASVETAAWQRRYRHTLLILDAVLILVATFAAARVRFGSQLPTVHGYSYIALSGAIAIVWLVSLGGVRAYEHRYLGSGSEEYKRVGSASVRLLAMVATLAYLLQVQVARGYVAVALPLGTVLLLIGRYVARRWLHEQRAQGKCVHRVLAIGAPESVAHLSRELQRSPHAGLCIVGVCTPYGTPANKGVDGDIPVVGSLATVVDALQLTNADTVAVASGPGVTPDALRRLSWQLEGTGIDLVVAPALTDVAGPRINIRPVAGLPLLHVDEPELTGMRQRVKTAIERVVATTVLALVFPLLAVLMSAICLETRGAPVFRQRRVGRHGREFTVFKLRTMRADAAALLAEIAGHNEHGTAPLFKVRNDPRVTRIGGWLRKWSLDELPQLWNVVRGDMSIIGPRPPLPTEVARYGGDAKRRLLVRPGMTGLWQVSGRSDLSWDDTVRLDLYYVENWSVAMDLTILWKTAFAVFQGRGAY